jgi:CheY-like chemotaxis protein
MSVLVLVVDDETDMEALFRQRFRRDLREGRFIMAFADSGPRALEVIKAEHETDIILLLSDINMPGMTGFELLETVRRVRPGLSVIMITAYGDDETLQRAITGGAEKVLSKPIDFNLLGAEIDQRLEQRMNPP